MEQKDGFIFMLSIMNYTNKKYMKGIKRLKYQRLIFNHKEKQGISKIENKLSQYNSKSVNFAKFKEYIKIKIKIK